jgi:hypothetical protein
LPDAQVGGSGRSAAGLMTDAAAGVVFRPHSLEVGVEVRVVQFSGTTYTQNRGLIIGATLAF